MIINMTESSVSQPHKKETKDQKKSATTSASPAPEAIGFQSLKGFDTHQFESGKKGGVGERITSLDNKAERFGRIERYLKNVAEVATDPQTRTEAVNALVKLEEKLKMEDLTDLSDLVSFVKRVIANFNNEAYLKVVLAGGARDITQDLIARQGQALLGYIEEQSLSNAAWAAMELAKERYYQDNEGHAYRTVEEQNQLEEAKQRVKSIKVS